MGAQTRIDTTTGQLPENEMQYVDDALHEILHRPELPAGQMEPPVLVDYELSAGCAAVVTGFRQNRAGQIIAEVDMHDLKTGQTETARWHGTPTGGLGKHTTLQAIFEAVVTAWNYVHPVEYIRPSGYRPEPATQDDREPDIADLYEQYEADGCYTCDCGNRLEIDCATCGDCGTHNPLSDLC